MFLNIIITYWFIIFFVYLIFMFMVTAETANRIAKTLTIQPADSLVVKRLKLKFLASYWEFDTWLQA